MLIYKKAVIHRGQERLELMLIQHGAPTKPYFLCQVRHQGRSPQDLSAPASFFLEQHGCPTMAIEATVSLARGFIMYGFTHSLEATHEYIRQISTRCQGQEWQKIQGIALGIEQEALKRGGADGVQRGANE